MHITTEQAEALKSLYAEFELIYRYAEKRSCDDSNKIIADLIRLNAVSECSKQNMAHLKAIVSKYESFSFSDELK